MWPLTPNPCRPSTGPRPPGVSISSVVTAPSVASATPGRSAPSRPLKRQTCAAAPGAGVALRAPHQAAVRTPAPAGLPGSGPRGLWGLLTPAQAPRCTHHCAAPIPIPRHARLIAPAQCAQRSRASSGPHAGPRPLGQTQSAPGEPRRPPACRPPTPAPRPPPPLPSPGAWVGPPGRRRASTHPATPPPCPAPGPAAAPPRAPRLPGGGGDRGPGVSSIPVSDTGRTRPPLLPAPPRPPLPRPGGAPSWPGPSGARAAQPQGSRRPRPGGRAASRTRASAPTF